MRAERRGQREPLRARCEPRRPVPVQQDALRPPPAAVQRGLELGPWRRRRELPHAAVMALWSVVPQQVQQEQPSVFASCR